MVHLLDQVARAKSPLETWAAGINAATALKMVFGVLTVSGQRCSVELWGKNMQ
jgi:hypothetical protein